MPLIGTIFQGYSLFPDGNAIYHLNSRASNKLTILFPHIHTRWKGQIVCSTNLMKDGGGAELQNSSREDSEQKFKVPTQFHKVNKKVRINNT